MPDYEKSIIYYFEHVIQEGLGNSAKALEKEQLTIA
jgi:hypothetical protein